MKRTRDGTYVVHVGRRGVVGFRYPPMREPPGEASNVVAKNELRLASHCIALLAPRVAGGTTARMPMTRAPAPLFRWYNGEASAKRVAKVIGGRAVRVEEDR
jgi:hypothetical protein